MSRWEPLLEQVVHERYGRLVAYATLLAGSRTEGEDLVQDALVSTFGSRVRLRSVPEAEAYVRRAIASRSIDRGRRRTLERRALATVGSRRESGPGADPVADAGLVGQDVVEALGRLSPRVRACVVLRHMEDLSVRDTAHALGLSEGAVKRYVSDGVAQLNSELGTQSSAHVPVEATEKEVRRA